MLNRLIHYDTFIIIFIVFFCCCGLSTLKLKQKMCKFTEKIIKQHSNCCVGPWTLIWLRKCWHSTNVCHVAIKLQLSSHCRVGNCTSHLICSSLCTLPLLVSSSLTPSQPRLSHLDWAESYRFVCTSFSQWTWQTGRGFSNGFMWHRFLKRHTLGP